MTQRSRKVGVIVARRNLSGPWASESWLPVSILPDVPEMTQWTSLGESADGESFYAGDSEIELFPGQTAHYRDNLVSGRPSLWVSLRASGSRYEVATVTADPYEGESMAEGIGEIVEALPMPASIQTFVADFIQDFHVERPFIKRKRDRVGDRESGGPSKFRG
ncbi:MAG: molybdopterin-guanine dinucleotide biosynthesis protein [Hyphomicrobiales bacterium]|nr:molybdopterin-guanine dinucleotide biosynthesis protein [Hyphomicrobiales bacterium]